MSNQLEHRKVGILEYRLIMPKKQITNKLGLTRGQRNKMTKLTARRGLEYERLVVGTHARSAAQSFNSSFSDLRCRVVLLLRKKKGKHGDQSKE